MLGNHSSNSAVVFIGLLVCSLAGCQTVDHMFAKVGLRKSEDPPHQGPSDKTLLAELSDLPAEKITAKQKADVQMAIARSLEKQGDTDKAINAYREVIHNDASRVDAVYRLAVLLDKSGQFQASEELYHTALSIGSNNPDLLCDWGYHCYLKADYQQAETHLRKAISLNDGLARAHNNLGLLLGRTGRCDEALRHFVKAGCSEADARANLALALSLEGQNDAAREQFVLAAQAGSTSDTTREGLRVLGATGSETPPGTQPHQMTQVAYQCQFAGDAPPNANDP